MITVLRFTALLQEFESGLKVIWFCNFSEKKKN
jgi:hypothetical protein